jgi:hypothetical protein
MHVHSMLVNSCEIIHLNLGVQFTSSQHGHLGGVHGVKTYVTWIV